MILITSGEPAGIGPDICLMLDEVKTPVVIMGDINMLQARAAALGLTRRFKHYDPQHGASQADVCWVWHVPVCQSVIPGQLNVHNSPYVLTMIEQAVDACLAGQFSALVTAPVHKGIINEAGIPFTGHTEFLAQRCGVDHVVMLLMCEAMKVALVTTHLPLRAVPAAITVAQVTRVIQQVLTSMRQQFGYASPRVWVAGLNPHAGESGHLGREEIDVITPVIHAFQAQGEAVQGPFPADTLFTPAMLAQADVVVAMYHDQGLPVLKYAGFGHAVNMTLGLPIIRTSVDHGTALDLAGTGRVEVGSLEAAVAWARHFQ